jgi:putative NADH-flavin reductase
VAAVRSDELRKHDWEWIAVRPMGLTDGPRAGQYRVVMDGLPRGGTRISRADVADFMLKQLTSNEYVHRIPAIAY